ncbi:MAG: double-strand break repair protein AddB, partial [Alphaproteobacteria bacterium]|nr:double-strand break repair protein AddB [Alphaproteobacteria bacterium]
MTAKQPALFSLAAGSGFVDALAAGILSRHGADPLELTRLTVLLPTRRAVGALQLALLRAGEGRPLLLPNIRALGDVEEAEATDDAWLAAAATDLPPAVGALRRRLLLTALVQRSRTVSSAQAALLAGELAHLLDRLQTEEIPLSRLHTLVPADHAAHWQVTLDFLRILEVNWPAILAAEGVIDPAERRARALRALARHWQDDPPAWPVIAAGSTGSIPATAELLSVVALLPQGAVVLPGLDARLDEPSWRELEPTHPQYGLKLLLARLGCPREAVTDWDAAVSEPAARATLLREALRPAATSEAWPDMPSLPPEALTGLGRLDCANEQEEAGAIAVILREAVEDPATTAALVTPDRGLARRVAAELRRWDIALDDSAGQPLADSMPGTLLRLAAALIEERVAPVALLALLKHPLALLGRAPATLRGHARRLERSTLRGPRPQAGFDALIRAAHASDAGTAVREMLEELHRAAETFVALDAQASSLATLLAAHVGLAERLARDAAGEIQLWAGETGEALASFIAELREAAGGLPAVPAGEYPGLFERLIAEVGFRPRHGQHPRLHLWGPLEARLQRVDLVVLGGLNEGGWPAPATADPWLSRPMQAQLGLPLPERRIGQAAHDFASLASLPRVVLTRAQKQDGNPTVPSRWLARLDNVLAAAQLTLPSAETARQLAWRRALDRPARIVPCGPPRFAPPLTARPRRLSVTRVERWLHDPYEIFARHILRLEPLEPLDAAPDAAERGIAVHQALDDFIFAHRERLPADAEAALQAAGRAAFGALLERPAVAAFWWPRFLRIARWFLDQETAWRQAGGQPLAVECQGALSLHGPAGPFTLTATADRIDRLRTGGLAIIDYKTGQVPGARRIAKGDAPQLPLEAAIAQAGGFAGVAA